MWLSSNFNNLKEVGEFETLKELKREGKRLLKEGAYCANNQHAREFAYLGKDKNLVFEWIK